MTMTQMNLDEAYDKSFKLAIQWQRDSIEGFRGVFSKCLNVVLGEEWCEDAENEYDLYDLMDRGEAQFERMWDAWLNNELDGKLEKLLGE